MPEYLIRFCLTILLISFFSGELNAQSDLDKQRMKKNKIHTVTIKKLNKADMNDDDGATVETVMEFDKDGNVIKYTSTLSDTEVFSITSKYENDRIIFSKDLKNGKLQTYTDYKYDDKNILTEQVMIVLYDNTGQNDTTATKYEYNQNGTIKLTRMNSAFSKDFGETVTEYSYDKNGNETSQIRKNKDGAVEISINKTYDDKNRVIDYNIFNGHDFFMHTTYEYDSSGAMIKNAKYDENGTEKSETNYKNDANGLVQISIFFDEVKYNWLYRKYIYKHY